VPNLSLYLADAVAISVLVFGLYYPRHRRRDLLVALVGVNVGVMAVSSVLMSTTIGAGLGLGLFGILSIIRLRSDVLSQSEIAYYFMALALGLLGGLASVELWLACGLMGAIIFVMFVVDHPALFRESRHQVIVVDHAIVDEGDLVAHLEDLLTARVTGIQVLKLDLVGDCTTVDVRFRTLRKQHGTAAVTTPKRVRVSV